MESPLAVKSVYFRRLSLRTEFVSALKESIVNPPDKGDLDAEWPEAYD